jgi:hypothetical protein
MTHELLLPTVEEHTKYMAKQKEHQTKGVFIAGGVALASAVISETFFRPAIGGTLVGMIGAMSQFAKFHIEFHRFHKKYPDFWKVGKVKNG